ncbi:hypothetical protein P7K49_026847 [Saguinus oedipus]|uniref:Uncharacterized protein n=1 Tax=Saguinus oedipus TaxID=9490 RepID=A0ABQ9UEL9_SAGOE|nr:hypothetical protein P7K49_026847 [Saguinus oedipus]
MPLGNPSPPPTASPPGPTASERGPWGGEAEGREGLGGGEKAWLRGGGCRGSSARLQRGRARIHDVAAAASSRAGAEPPPESPAERPPGAPAARRADAIEPRYYESWTRETESTWLTYTDSDAPPSAAAPDSVPEAVARRLQNPARPLLRASWPGRGERSRLREELIDGAVQAGLAR